MPIVPVDDVDDAIRVIRERPAPLALYVFTNSEVTKNLCKSTFCPFMVHRYLGLFYSVVQKTRSGQLVLNDTLTQLAVHEIPFGGVGESGCT